MSFKALKPGMRKKKWKNASYEILRYTRVLEELDAKPLKK